MVGNSIFKNVRSAKRSFDELPANSKLQYDRPNGRALRSAKLKQMLFCAAFHEIPSLRTDYLLVDRLFEAIEVSLGHAKLHLILLLLAFHSL